MTPVASTCMTIASLPPLLVSDDVPNAALPEKKPATKAPPSPSAAMAVPFSSSVPPPETAQSITPSLLACSTTMSVSPLLVKVVEPKEALP